MIHQTDYNLPWQNSEFIFCKDRVYQLWVPPCPAHYCLTHILWVTGIPAQVESFGWWEFPPSAVTQDFYSSDVIIIFSGWWHSYSLLHATTKRPLQQTTMMQIWAKNDFTVSNCMEEGSVPTGPCSSTPILSFIRNYFYEHQTYVICSITWIIALVSEAACCVVASSEAGDPGPGQQHPHKQVWLAWSKIAPPPNIISLPYNNLDTSILFHREGMTVRAV